MRIDFEIDWKQVVTAFLIGLIAGVAVMQWRTHHRFYKRWHERGRPGQEKPFERRLERFSSKLGLTPEQQDRVAGIFDSQGEAMEAIRDECGPKLEAVRKSTEEQIRGVLTPEQEKKFTRMRKGPRPGRGRGFGGPFGPREKGMGGRRMHGGEEGGRRSAQEGSQP
ncbi:MAG: hypothetical protein ABII00_11655 [Elusimicrobiota bacterium]